jgi:ATP-dependent protease ClpP protease subunit
MKTIWIRDYINWKTMVHLERALAKAGPDGLRVLICCQGGDVDCVYTLCDFMRLMSADFPIQTIACGEVFSGAPLLVAAGSQGQRFSLPGTTWGVHLPYSSNQTADPAVARAEADCLKLMQKRYVEVLAENSRQPVKYWTRRLAKRSMLYFTADEAFDCGLVDAVLTAEKRRWD